MLDDSLFHSLRQIHGDHLPEITLSLLGLLLAHVFPFNYLATGGSVDDAPVGVGVCIPPLAGLVGSDFILLPLGLWLDI